MKHDTERENKEDENLEDFDDVYLIQTVADIFFGEYTLRYHQYNHGLVCVFHFRTSANSGQEEIDKIVKCFLRTVGPIIHILSIFRPGSLHVKMKDSHQLIYVEVCLFETMRLGWL